jgi:hypothetical protein
MGTPYGSYLDEDKHEVVVTYIGKLSKDEHRDVGGIAVYVDR